MKKSILLGFVLLIGLSSFIVLQRKLDQTKAIPILSYIVDPSKNDLKLYWKDGEGVNYKNFQNLKTDLERQNKRLLFAMNGGMYLQDLSPQGLFVEDGQLKKRINRTPEAYGNFYMQPNGVFYLTYDKKGHVKTTSQFKLDETVHYATQSGPMLVIEGSMHPKFKKGSANVHIRNGVGVLPDGRILFAMSKEKINLYDFAAFFMDQGCKNALYLDGFVSRTYLPEQNWMQMESNFGVMIGVTENIN